MIIMNTNYIILYKFHTKFIQIQNFPSFFVILITNHCSLTFFSPPASPEAIADKNQRSRISSFATHPYSWNRERSRVLSQFEHGLVRATNQFPHADILERCIEKLVHTVRARCVQALAPFHSFTSRIRLPASFRVEAGRILASILPASTRNEAGNRMRDVKEWKGARACTHRARTVCTSFSIHLSNISAWGNWFVARTSPCSNWDKTRERSRFHEYGWVAKLEIRDLWFLSAIASGDAGGEKKVSEQWLVIRMTKKDGKFWIWMNFVWNLYKMI